MGSLILSLWLLLQSLLHLDVDTKEAQKSVNPVKIQQLVAQEPIKQPATLEEKYADVKGEIYLVTSYTAGIESTGKRKGDKGYGVTASGAIVKVDHTIACPKSMKFGTQIYIPELNNVYVCEDTGSKINNKHIDLFMEDLDEALEFGRQKLEVKILPNRRIEEN